MESQRHDCLSLFSFSCPQCYPASQSWADRHTHGALEAQVCCGNKWVGLWVLKAFLGGPELDLTRSMALGECGVLLFLAEYCWRPQQCSQGPLF